jgi:hypothetical protein
VYRERFHVSGLSRGSDVASAERPARLSGVLLLPLSRTWQVRLRPCAITMNAATAKGYPDGFIGGAIPLGARILTVVYSYSAITNRRCTRGTLRCSGGLGTEKARRDAI